MSRPSQCPAIIRNGVNGLPIGTKGSKEQRSLPCRHGQEVGLVEVPMEPPSEPCGEIAEACWRPKIQGPSDRRPSGACLPDSLLTGVRFRFVDEAGLMFWRLVVMNDTTCMLIRPVLHRFFGRRNLRKVRSRGSAEVMLNILNRTRWKRIDVRHRLLNDGSTSGLVP